VKTDVSTVKFTVITLFPQLIDAFAQNGLVGQASGRGDLQIATINPRQFTTDAHHTVDDRAYGGGDGMVMKFEPLRQAVQAAGEGRLIVLSPQGRPWTQADARACAGSGQSLILVCGRYAGIDQRFVVASGAEEVSIGDYILNGGEIGACAIIESIARLRPQVLGNGVSALRDSFGEDRYLECPQFTRPREVEGLPVPSPLLSGHHELVRRFERAVARVRTACLRPDLLPEGAQLGDEIKLLAALNDDELKALGLSRTDLEGLK
jgi:tRNA (guanine37-N1)-methyltransferase